MEPRRIRAATRACPGRGAPREALGRRGTVPDETFWWRALADAADGALLLRSDGRIVEWNSAATRITGYEAAEVLGRRCCTVFAGGAPNGNGYCAASCLVFNQIRRDGPVPTVDVQITSKAGRALWLSISTVALRGDQVKVPYAIRTFRDVTAVRDMLALIGHRFARTPADDQSTRLSRRELEVLRFMAAGATNRAMAYRLRISPATVRNHTHHIYEKLGVHSRLRAVTFAISQFWI